MIVQMKKVTVLISARDHDAALRTLGDLGVIHIDHVRAPASDELAVIEKKLSHTDRALQSIQTGGDQPESVDEKNTAKIVDRIVRLVSRKESLLRELSDYQKQERWFNEWGAVSLESLEMTRKAGITIRFHICPKKMLKHISGDDYVVIVKQVEDRIYLAHLTDASSPGLDCPEDPMPPVEVVSLRCEIDKINQSVADIDRMLQEMAAEAGKIRAYRRQLMMQREFASAKYGMGEAESIVYLQGYVPVTGMDAIETAAEKASWGYVFEDPDNPGDAPTLVRNPKWIRMIRPVFSFMGTIPGYTEYDISFWFLLFFSLFYAMLVGDAGYGLIFLAATFLARLKYRHLPWEPFALMYVLSGATIIWGAISGTWFGMTDILEMKAFAFLKSVVIQPISSIGGDQDFMMFLCFLIGAVHLTIAHSLIAIRNRQTPNALAQPGWIAVIWGLFFVAETLVLGKPLRPFALPLLIAGFVTIMLFENYRKHMVIKGALASLANLPLSVISAFSDVVSYLRLFAVGFATFIVASSFNQMAADIAGGVVGTAVAAVILFLGHAINIILAVMAVVVHGIRLNMLEFSGHLNMQWSGKAYQPFTTVKDMKTT
jgi:V/A-type H+/Na+-transporting ATPase subunit I